MIRLLFVGDGPRDEASLPPLVGTILNIKIDNGSEFRAWKSLRVGGYPRKLLFAIRIVRDRQLPGLIAVVDSDRQPARLRLRELQDARKKDRVSNPPLPTGLGEARPNVDAWLLDDATAVREALRLPSDFEVPSLRNVPDPKDALNEVITAARSTKANVESGDRRISTLPVLSDIAAKVSLERCLNARDTGFEGFRKDVLAELKDLRRQ